MTEDQKPIVRNLLRYAGYKREDHYWVNHELKSSISDKRLFAPESPSPSSKDSSVLVEALEDFLSAVPPQTDDADWWPDNLCKAVESAKKFLYQYKSQPGSLQGEQESITFLEWVGKEGWQWSELNTKWFKYGSDDYLNETQLHELFKERDVTEEHKSDREPEGIDIVKTENELLSKCLNMLRYFYMNEYCGEHGPEVFELIRAK